LTSFTQTTDIDLGAKHNQVVNYLDNYDFTNKSPDDFTFDLVSYTGKLYDPSFILDIQAKGGIYGIFQICGKLDAPPDWFTYQNVIDELQKIGEIASASNNFKKSLMSETENLPDYNSFIFKVK